MSKIYSANLKRGQKYGELRKTVCIIIVDDVIPEFKEIAKSQTNWQIREEKYTNIILTDYFHICIIELPKAIKEYETNKQDALLQWMKFLDNPKDAEVAKIMEENENIKEAKEEIDRISQDDLLRRMDIKAEMQEFDHRQMMYEAKRDGMIEGEKKGERKGIIKGEKRKQLEIAKNLLKCNIPVETIALSTGLTKEEIESLK